MVQTHGSLFSGIGGFDLAAQWMGWQNAFHCEINPFGQRILKHYWPDARSFSDITTTDFTEFNGQIDILTGGFPCQPYSTAGKRLGKDDERHLWPHMLRAIGEIRPNWVVGENVRGLVNWNGGMVFNQVQADLEATGYEVIPFLLPACGVNAPHRRERIWFVAHFNSHGHEYGELTQDRCPKTKSPSVEEKRKRVWDVDRRVTEQKITTNTSGERRGEERENISRPSERDTGASDEWPITDPRSKGLPQSACSEQQEFYRSAESPEGSEFVRTFTATTGWESFPTQSPLCTGDDGLSSRLDGITFSKWRTESVKGAGNAIVPQVVYRIFKAIESLEITY